ncbi:MAG TPA: sigma-70 family RNA polymerase sigma factor [Candidatus Eremiobacteraceae bacterium]|nr:sigma-70 family RNA polymerase sigma factor [Candidatus Eremiobacteraceae bacterium]
MGSSDSADIVRRLQSDDPVALEEAFALFGGRCNAIAYGVLHDDQAAADAVQDAFLSLWQHRHGLVVRGAGLGPWLFVVVRNAALTIFRKDSARSNRESRSELLQPPDASPDPAQAVAGQDQAAELRRVMTRLPEEQKNVLELAYFGFLTLAQIAERTNTPLGTVKRRAQRALQQLHSLMSGHSP